VLEKEQILERVLAASAAPRRRFEWLWGTAAAVAFASALAIAVLPARDGELTPRGGAPGLEPPLTGLAGTARGPELRVSCLQAGRPSACAPGATLAFEATAGAGFDYVALFGQRRDGTIVWYAPAPEGQSTRVGAEPKVLAEGARLAAQDAGELRVYGVFSREPLSRAALKAKLGATLPADDAQAARVDAALRVVVRTLRTP
jgi:hypothetical protein